ncbi:TsaE protein [Minicystis rosea]|nr:TsaE protein [Minicystis rosea]
MDLVALPTRRATIHLAERLAPALAAGDLVVLEGDLGAGKTFFSRALCRALGVPPSIPVTSPTFTIVHEYDGRLPIRHADLYRLHGPEELGPLGLREQRGDGALLLIEWGTPYLDALGGDALVLSLRVSPAGERTAHPRGTGPRGDALARTSRAP